MALIRTITQFQRALVLTSMFAILGLSTACSDLDPVKVVSKCDGPAPIDERCPQCQIPQFASECPQCQQSGLDDGTCLPPGVPWKDPQTSEGNVSTLPDGGVIGNEGGQASPDGSGAPGESPGSENNPGNPSNPGATPGSSDSRPSSGAGGSGGGSAAGNVPMAGRMAPTRGPSGCLKDEDCTTPGFPACAVGDGTCLECLENKHCQDGKQCNKQTNRCVECTDNDPCTPQGKVCFPTGRVCVQCNNDADCPTEKHVCTPDHECVACSDSNSGYCPVETPACFESACVECNADPDCTRDGTHACIKAEHRCVECTAEAQCRSVAGRTHCDVESNACVACLKDADCSDPSASHCDPDSHSCVPCSSATHCAQFAGTTPQCADGQCVACDREGGICSGKACILSTHVCSDKNRMSVAACNECASSDECIAGHVCVPTAFGATSTGNRCMPNYADYRQAGKPCPRPYSRKVTKVDTVEAFHVETLCALQDTTSCEALLDTLSNKDCGGNNRNCGLGEYDGYCGMDGCTYNCMSSDYCPNAMTCSEAMKICL